MKQVRPSERSGRVRYAIRDIMLVAQEAQEAGKQLLRLNIGDPLLYDFQTPAHMIEAVHQAMLAGHNGYAPSSGIPEALDAVRAEAARDGIRTVQEVFISAGVSEAIEMSFAALVDPGDNVLIPSPGYPLYEAALLKFGAEGISYTLDEQNNWRPDLDDIARRITPRTRGIVVINPNNPTGAVFSREVLLGIAELASRHGLVLFADEIYSKMLLDPVQHHALGALAPELPVVTLNGLSKSYLVPGFRTAWIIISGEGQALGGYCEAISKMMRLRLSANHPAQFAVRAALEGDQSHIAEVTEKLRRRRDLTVSLLNSVPNIHCSVPQAAFYAFPRLEIPRADTDFVMDLIRQTGVIVVPGSGFGQAPGSKHFRMVFLPPDEVLERGLRLISDFARNFR